MKLQVGQRVRVRHDARGATGKFRKCCGREGVIEKVRPLIVRFGPRSHEYVANLRPIELEPA